MAEFLACAFTVILVETYVLDARIALEIEDALGGQAQKMSDLVVTGIPQMTVVARIFDQHFMRANRVHAVVNAIASAVRFAFNMVKRAGMNDGTSRPGNAGRAGRSGDHL